MPLLREGAESYCRWLTLQSHSHFQTAIRLLPYPQRQAMEAVYAFCRAVDDLVDRDGGISDSRFLESAQRELALWREELTACAEGFPTHPITVALQPVVHRYRIPMELFEGLLKGVEMDLTSRRYTDFQELKVYCGYVASVVGLISVRVFGCTHPASESYARNLGIALQLTNILRDIKTDAARGRIYLPQEELSLFGYSEEDLFAHRYNEAFRRLMAFQCERAWGFFRDAQRDLKESGEERKLYTAQMMAGVYARLLRRIERIRYDVFSTQVKVPRLQQIWVALQCLLG